MKCPLMIANVPLAMSEDNPAVGDCIQERCGWWDVDQSICAMLLIAQGLRNVDTRLIYINRNMPHEPINKK